MTEARLERRREIARKPDKGSATASAELPHASQGKAPSPTETRYSVERTSYECLDEQQFPDFVIWTADEISAFQAAREAAKAAEIAARFPPNPSAKDVPESARTVRSYFPSVHDKCIEEIAATARRTEPQISDQELARILKETYKPGYQRTPKLWLETIPERLVLQIDAELDELVKIPSDKWTDEQAERYDDLDTRFKDRTRDAVERLVARLIQIPLEDITEEDSDIFWDLSFFDAPGLCEAECRFQLAAFRIKHHLSHEASAELREEFEFTPLSEINDFRLQNHLTTEDLEVLFTFAFPRCAVCGARPEAPHSDGVRCFCAAHCRECANQVWRRSVGEPLGGADPERFTRNNKEELEPGEKTTWVAASDGDQWGGDGQALFFDPEVDFQPIVFKPSATTTAATAPKHLAAMDVPETARTVRSCFPAASEKDIEQIAAATRRVEPQISDEKLARILKATYSPGYHQTLDLWQKAVNDYLWQLIDADLDHLEGISLEDMTDDQAERYHTLIERFPERERSARERLLVTLISTPFEKITKETCDAFWNLDGSIPWMPGVCGAYYRFALAECKIENDLTDEEFSRFCEEGTYFPYTDKLELRNRYHLTEEAFNTLSELAFAKCDECGAKPHSLHTTWYGHSPVSRGYFCAAHCPACAGIDRPDRMPLWKLDTERLRAFCKLNDQVQLSDDIFGARHEFPVKVEQFGWVGGGVFLSPARYYNRAAEELTQAENSPESELILFRTVATARALYQLYEERLLLQESHDAKWVQSVAHRKFDEIRSSLVCRPDWVAALAVDTAIKCIPFNDEAYLTFAQEHVFGLTPGLLTRERLARYLHPYRTGLQPVKSPEDRLAEALSANDAALFVRQSVQGPYCIRHRVKVKPFKLDGKDVLQLSAIDKLKLDESCSFGLRWRINVNWDEVAECLDDRTVRELRQTLAGSSVEEMGKTDYNHFREQLPRIRKIVFDLHRLSLKFSRPRLSGEWVSGLG